MKHIIVAGLGPSMVEAQNKLPGYFTIGVNDIARYFTPDHLYVSDSPDRFKNDREDVIRETAAKTIWMTQKWDNFQHPDLRRVRTLGFDRVTDFELRRECLPHFKTSPFAAIGLAYKLGAKRIGVIGVDLLDSHNMSVHRHGIGIQLAKLAILLNREHVQLVNLSKISTIDTIPKMSLSYMENKVELLVHGDTAQHDFTGWKRFDG